MSKCKQTKIIFSGGGTGGPVAPLLALAQDLTKKRPDWDLIWVGTNNGLERNMVKELGLSYVGISSGKWRRYFSVKNFLDWFKIIIGFFQSLLYLLLNRPKLVMSAGGFVSVPLAWAAGFLKIPVIVHQQDVRPGLANKLMAVVATTVTTTFSKSLNDYGKKAVLTGNPVRKEFESLPSREKALSDFDLQSNLPIVTIMGGGAGAVTINKLAKELIPILKDKCQIIHIAGANKDAGAEETDQYKPFQFVAAQKLAAAFLISDVVVSRGGLGSITELSYLKKTAIFIPILHSHQEDNTDVVQADQAGLVLRQDKLDAQSLAGNILNLLSDKDRSQKFAENLYNLIPQDSKDKLIDIIISHVEKSN